jgi:hypothetical protein
MDSNEIARILENALGHRFGGVYPANRVPRLRVGKGYVLNNMCDQSPGMHWIGLYVTNKRIELFDSYGLGPMIYTFVPRNKTILYNTTQIQGPNSNSCGQFVCAFLINRVHGITMKQFLSSFTNNWGYNDHLVNWISDRI